LEGKIDTMPLKDLVVELDKIYDMQHNNGSILNKGKWYVDKKVLDKRHHLRDIREMLPYVSDVVKKAILSNLNHFYKDPGFKEKKLYYSGKNYKTDDKIVFNGLIHFKRMWLSL
jgi:hypothetical protein